MFAAMVFDRDPLQWKNVPALFEYWVQVTGGFAAIGATLWLIFGLLLRMSPADRSRISPAQGVIFLGSTVAADVFLAIGFVLSLLAAARANPAAATAATQVTAGKTGDKSQLFLTIGGAFGLVAAGMPFFLGVLKLRVRRIYAIAKLSFKEAVRRRILYVFSILLLVFLFASWFIPHKPEDQVRTYVGVLYLSMTILLLLAGTTIASFSIPTDIRNSTIHTILTKPVERFEVVLGRFLGFMALLTLALVVMTGLGMLYLVRGVDPEAAEESLKARQPMNGELTFLNTSSDKKGDSVGREWDYRSYITRGAPGKDEEFWPTAVWTFDAVPRRVADRQTVRCEFGFDIYRTTKGKEGKGVACSFTFETAGYNKEALRRYLKEQKEQGKTPGADEVAEAQGFFEVPAKDVTDYHTQYIDVPAGLFRNALQSGGGRNVRVKVRCTDPTQYVGMAKHDLYLRLDDPEGGSEQLAFSWNFFKGAAGVWYRLCLVAGLGVVVSTALSGVITGLVTVLLYLGGVCVDFMRSVGAGTNIGGGPTESLYRLTTRQNMNAPLDKTGGVRILETTDQAFRWAIRRVTDLIPDVDRFDLSGYVAEGFNIPPEQLLLNLLLVVGYLLPWFVLGFYLLKWREVASAT